MDDLLIFLIALFCGDGQALPPDPVLLALFQAAEQEAVACVDPDERIRADYPRLLLSGEEGEQDQTGDGDAKFFAGSVRLEIVTRQSDAVPDEMELLAQIKARCTKLLLGDANAELPPVQGQNFAGSGGAAYNVSAFSQVRPTGRLPAEDPTIKRWGATYRVRLCRLNLLGPLPATLLAPASTPSVQSQIAALTQQIEDLQMSFRNSFQYNGKRTTVALTAAATLTKPAVPTDYLLDTTAAAFTVTLWASTGDGSDCRFYKTAGAATNPASFALNASDTTIATLANTQLVNIGDEQGWEEIALNKWGAS